MSLLKPRNEESIVVRMYRQGHGDCFLIAFPNETREDRAYYVLIDFGYKPGSRKFLFPEGKKITEFSKSIKEATNGNIDLLIITHEHQDHLNGFTKTNFKNIKIHELWLAWTEDPRDDLANSIREIHKDTLLKLVNSHGQLALSQNSKDKRTADRLLDMLSLEYGGAYDLGAKSDLLQIADPAKSRNKRSLKLMTDKIIDSNIKYLSPGKKIETIKENGINAYILGPPRDNELLTERDINIGDTYHVDSDDKQSTFSAAIDALGPNKKSKTDSPFENKYHTNKSSSYNQYFSKKKTTSTASTFESPKSAEWRQIELDWLNHSEFLALKLNTGINNTSLVIAFELPKNNKILLFAADAQLGSWVSWHKHSWEKDSKTITTKDLLGRTVLYKAGHHGSHNATLKGEDNDDYANLAWMAKDEFASEFTVLIPAEEDWAYKKYKWKHPLPSLKKALLDKSRGKLLQTNVKEPIKPENVSEEEWETFVNKIKCEELYFDLTIDY